MKIALNAIIATLATRRLTSLITEDKITEDIRTKFWEIYPPDTTKLGFLVSCRKCASMWAGLAALCLLTLSNNLFAQVIVKALALSEVVILTDKYVPKEFDL